MKYAIVTGVIAATFLIAGCGKKSSTNSTRSVPADAASSSPVAQPALTAWQQGDKTAAVSNFLATDWKVRPLFAADSTLNLTEGQFKALSDTDREAKSRDMTSQLASMKQLAQAITQAGNDATAKGDTALARKYFTSLQQCGVALENSDRMLIVQLVGKAFVKMSEAELSKIDK